MKNKITYSNYDKETGTSLVEISNSYGSFVGISHLQEEDKAHASTFAGCKYAEIKANISYAKERARVLRYQIKALEDYEKILKGMSCYNIHSIENKKLRRRIYELKAEKKKWEDKQIKLKDTLFSTIKERENALKEIEKIKKGKNN